MKITEAVWEQRNLGVSCAEIEIGKNDTPDEVIAAVNARKEQYLVAKVAPAKVDVMFALQKCGFNYIETLFRIENNIGNERPVLDICRSAEEDAGYHIASDSETEDLLSEIRTGAVFSTDRIALDPFFSREAAGRRYAGWIEDVLGAGNASVIIGEYHGDSIGFNVVVDKGRKSDAILGGAFGKYLDSSMGVINAYCGLLRAYDAGIKKVISHVSSNNLQMLRINLMLGNKIKELTYNYIRHSGEQTHV